MRMSLPEPPMRVSLPEPPTSFACGRAPLVSSSVMMLLFKLAAGHVISPVLATVGVSPTIGTSPLLTRIVPAASRLMVTVLTDASPVVVGAPG